MSTYIYAELRQRTTVDVMRILVGLPDPFYIRRLHAATTCNCRAIRLYAL